MVLYTCPCRWGRGADHTPPAFSLWWGEAGPATAKQKAERHLSDTQGPPATKQRQYCTTFDRVDSVNDWGKTPVHPDGENPAVHTLWELLSTQAVQFPNPDEPEFPDLMLVWTWGAVE